MRSVSSEAGLRAGSGDREAEVQPAPKPVGRDGYGDAYRDAYRDAYGGDEGD